MTRTTAQQTEGAHSLTLRTVETYNDGGAPPGPGQIENDSEAHHLSITIDNTSPDLGAGSHLRS